MNVRRLAARIMAPLIIMLFVAGIFIISLQPRAFAQLPFSVSSSSATNGTLTVSNLFYYIELNLHNGLRASSWLVNITSPSLLPIIPTGNTQVPSPLISISSPNSTEVPLPGNLTSTTWLATVVRSTNNSETLKLIPASDVSYPFGIVVYMTFSRLEPYVRVLISVTNMGDRPAFAYLAYGAGAAGLTGTWAAAAQLENASNGSFEVLSLSNSSEVSGLVLTALAAYSSNSTPAAALGISSIDHPSSVEFLEGKLFGINESQAYIITFVRTPVLKPGDNFNVSLNLFAVGFNPFELASVGSLEAAEALYPGIESKVPQSMNVDGVVSSLNTELSLLNNSVKSLTQEVNNLSAKLYYYERQLYITKNAEGYYAHLARRGGILAGGMFVVGVIVGVLGGAYLLSPSGIERKQVKRK
ncbi:hypothetical protein [Acidilobus sp.]|uniref:hypothetical protein n=1 Tax=Acidilobus sp. TaxID=1872109 RepID=UPI003D013D45